MLLSRQNAGPRVDQALGLIAAKVVRVSARLKSHTALGSELTTIRNSVLSSVTQLVPD